jgi:hypothetical protein
MYSRVRETCRSHVPWCLPVARCCSSPGRCLAPLGTQSPPSDQEPSNFLPALQHTLCAPTQSRAAPSCPPHLARNHLFTPSKTAVLPLLWCQNTGRRAQNKHLRRCPSIASQHVSGSAPLSSAQQDPSLHSTQQQRESAPMIPSSALRCGGKTTSWGGSAQAHSWNQAQLQPRGIPWSRTARPEVS